MKFKIFPLMLIILFSGKMVSASLLQLDFLVDVFGYQDGTGSQIDPDLLINYSVMVDTSSPIYMTGTWPNGNTYADTSYSPSVFPKTPFSDDVLSQVVEPLGEPYNNSLIYREYSPTGFGNAVPETLESIFLLLGAASPITDEGWTSYQRGLQRQMPIGYGDLVKTFDETDYIAYMESLIGDSNFWFDDIFIISEFIDIDVSTTTYQYGYFGEATLTDVKDVSPVPLPSSILLFGSGLVVLVGTRVRRKKK
ncbi:hypothetical protein ACFL0S_01040 [Thermodesulfobacteriota bacterium]